MVARMTSSPGTLIYPVDCSFSKEYQEVFMSLLYSMKFMYTSEYAQHYKPLIKASRYRIIELGC